MLGFSILPRLVRGHFWGNAMPTERFTVSYDGPSVEGHEMDIAELAPSLLALATLCKEANRVLNGDRATVRLTVRADIQAKCVLVDLGLVLASAFDTVKALVGSENIKTAKDIIDWLFIGGTILVTTAQFAQLGLFDILKILEGRKPTFSLINGNVTLNVNINGDNNKVEGIAISQELKALLEDPRVIKHATDSIKPLAKPGYDSIEFGVPDRPKNKVSKKDAELIKSTSDALFLEEWSEPEIVTQWLKVYSPKFDPKAKTWQFMWGDRKITVDISEIGLAEQAIQNGVFDGDRHRIKFQIFQDADGHLKHKALELIASKKGAQQIVLPSQDQDGDGDD